MVFNKNLWLHSNQGIKASSLALGSSVFLMENGSPTEYMVVHKGLPSNLYDSSCDGLWLLRKDIYSDDWWHSNNTNSYESSYIHTYLNNTFLSELGEVEQATIKQVKLPYVNGTGGSAIAFGSNGLSTKVFLLGGYEVGLTTSVHSDVPVDGAKLDYFEEGSTEGGTNRSLRIAYLSGTAKKWWLRSSSVADAYNSWYISTEGYPGRNGCMTSYGIRPALILPHTAVFDKDTLILKG